MLRNVATKVLLLILGVILIIALDLWSKNIVVSLVPESVSWGWIKLAWYENYGISFGIELPGHLANVLIIGFIAVLLGLFWFSRNYPFIYYLGLIFGMGGGLGNLVDRLMFGFVSDFISIGYLPIFNLADIFIVLGVILMIIGVFISGRGKQIQI